MPRRQAVLASGLNELVTSTGPASRWAIKPRGPLYGGGRIFVGAQLGQGGQAGGHGDRLAGSHAVDPVPGSDGLGLWLGDGHRLQVVGVVIGPAQPDGQGQSCAAGPQQVAQHRPEDRPGESVGILKAGQGPAAAGGDYYRVLLRRPHAGMAGPCQAGATGASHWCGPWASVVSAGLLRQAVGLGQAEQLGHE